MSKVIVRVAFALTTLVLGLVIRTNLRPSKVHAEEFAPPRACLLGLLEGRYGSATTGLINSSRSPSDFTIPTFVPFAEAAFFTFDGHGSISGASTTDFGGQIDPSATPTPATGTYSVDSSTCTGKLTINVPGGPTFHRNFVIVGNATQLDFVSTDPGFVIAGSLKKQFFLVDDR